MQPTNTPISSVGPHAHQYVTYIEETKQPRAIINLGIYDENFSFYWCRRNRIPTEVLLFYWPVVILLLKIFPKRIVTFNTPTFVA